jgi:hypothetical protein
VTADSPYQRPPVEVLQKAHDIGMDRASERTSAIDAEHIALGLVASTIETSIAEELEALYGSTDDAVTREQILEAIADLARELRGAGRAH